MAKKNNIFTRTNLERRRIRWSSSKHTFKVFVTTILNIAFFTLIIVLFSTAVVAIFDAMGI